MGQAAFPSFVPRCPRLFAPLVLAILLLAAPANSLGETRASPGCNTDAMIVFDASGSMAGMGFGEKSITRIEQVRRALAEVVPAVAPVRNLGLVVFGPGARPVCENVDLRFPPGPDRGERIMAEVYGLQPYGQTPLTSAVDAAAEALDFRHRPAVIVLVTDGEETCRGDPCELAHRLRSQGLHVTVHVIGYMLRLANEPPGGRFARCLSEGTSGMFISTESTEELVEALQRTLTCPMVSLTQGVVAGR